MLKQFTSDLDFRAHLNFHNLNTSHLERLHDVQFKSAIHKLKKLFLNPAKDLIAAQYSPTGRPAIDPTILIRSFILMQHFGFTSPYLWCEKLKHDDLLRFLIGCNSAPSSSSHYDFINRMTHIKPNLHTLFPKDKNFINKKSKLKKGEKLINFTNEDSSSLADAYLSDSQWDRDRFSYTLQLLFNAIAVVPSQELGLLPTENLVLSGDGSSLHIHANGFGTKVKEEDPNGFTHRFSSPEADFGWDSDLGVHYFGFTLYNISHHDSSSKVDLPCFLSIEKASRHDALTTVSASAQ